MGQQILEMMVAFLRRYVVLSEAQALAMAVWCAHTWFYDRLSRTTAFVEITGVSGSGKSTLMEVMSLLSRGSIILNTLRTLAMCRYIEEHEGRVTIFIDEAERLESAAFGDQRSMLASGYRRGAVHLISTGDTTKQFGNWCPKAFTSLRTTTTVIHNRCIPIWLERGLPSARLSLEYERAEAISADIVERLKAFVLAQPRFLTLEADWLTSERDQEIWTPLVSMAATLGVDKATMGKLQAASVDLQSLRGVIRRMDAKVEDEAAQERSFAVRLIKDVCSVIQDGETAILSRVLVDRLRLINTAPWRNYQRSGLTEVTLAQLLGVFALNPATVRPGKGRKSPTGRGYYVKDLRAACKTAEVEAGPKHTPHTSEL